MNRFSRGFLRPKLVLLSKSILWRFLLLSTAPGLNQLHPGIEQPARKPLYLLIFRLVEALDDLAHVALLQEQEGHRDVL